MNSDLPPIPCPVCKNCDHDLRSGILELAENIGANLREAAEKLMDAMAAEGAAPELFIRAQQLFLGVSYQVSEVVTLIPDIAAIKAASHR